MFSQVPFCPEEVGISGTMDFTMVSLVPGPFGGAEYPPLHMGLGVEGEGRARGNGMEKRGGEGEESWEGWRDGEMSWRGYSPPLPKRPGISCITIGKWGGAHPNGMFSCYICSWIL